MKIPPKIYAQALYEALGTDQNLKTVASHFFALILKNHAQKELGRIFAELETLYAEANNLEIVEIRLPKPLTDSEKNLIIAKLESKIGKKIMPKFIIDNSSETGFTVKTSEKFFDYSLEGGINKLKNQFSNNS